MERAAGLLISSLLLCGGLVVCTGNKNDSDDDDDEATDSDSGANDTDTAGDTGTADVGPCADETQITYQGVDYSIIEIGDQCWFAENLRARQTSDGQNLIAGTPETWPGFQDGRAAWTYPGNDPGQEAIHGLLYNWHATTEGSGLCPEGWNIPSDEDWTGLEILLGVDTSELETLDWHGSDQGKQLKSASEWNGSDDHGFGAVASGGIHASYGTVTPPGSDTWFWSSTTLPTDSTKGVYRQLSTGEDRIHRFHTWKNHGGSIRCLKD